MELWGIHPHTLWFSIGFFMLAAELLSTGFVFFFLGIGALLTGILIYLGIELGVSGQIISFVFLSLGSLIALRKPLQKRFNKSKDGDYKDIEGQIGTVTTWNHQTHSGTVKYRGTQWQATSNDYLEEGSPVEIESVDGITLKVNAKG